MFLIILFLLAYNSSITAQLDDVEIIKSEMPKSMENFAIGQTLTALSMQNDFNIVAKQVINQMNTRFGKEWVTLVGTGLHTLVIGMNVQNNTFLLFSYKAKHIVLFKQGGSVSTQNQTRIYSSIEKSRQASANVIGSKNTTTLNFLVAAAKEVLLKDYKNCHSTSFTHDIKEWCFRDIGLALVDAINASASHRGLYTVTVGYSSNCFSESLGLTITESYLFMLEKIYFEIVKISKADPSEPEDRTRPSVLTPKSDPNEPEDRTRASVSTPNPIS